MPVITPHFQRVAMYLSNRVSIDESIKRSTRKKTRRIYVGQGLSRYLETGCPNRGFIDFCVSKVWYKIHTTNKINPIHLQSLLF